MKTKTKIALAQSGARIVRMARTLVGQGDTCIVERHGVRFELDLTQGIDFAIYTLGYFEPATAKALMREIMPGALVLDIGANIGAHTLHMAKRSGPEGRVLAFEPTDYAFAKLRRNLALNPDLAKRVVTHQCFLTGKDDAAVPGAIYSAWPLEARGAPVHEKHLGEAKSTNQAAARSIDSILAELGAPVVDMVKLDVDGFECDVLSGAAKMMQRDRPTFVMELSPYVLEERGASLERLLSYFLPLGYVFENERSGNPLGDAANIAAQIGDGASCNAVARVPRKAGLG